MMAAEQYGDALDAALRELQRAHERISALEKDAARWQPIETAPKDGAWIMAYGRDLSITAYPAVIFWDDGWCPAREGQPGFSVTHWMPLPTPPAIDAALAAEPKP